MRAMAAPSGAAPSPREAKLWWQQRQLAASQAMPARPPQRPRWADVRDDDVDKKMPHVKGKLTGMAFLVPTFDVSAVDRTCELVKETTYNVTCAEIQRRSEGDMTRGDMKGFPGYLDEALASTAFATCPFHSPSIDAGKAVAILARSRM